jgi:hypothetical protein
MTEIVAATDNCVNVFVSVRNYNLERTKELLAA